MGRRAAASEGFTRHQSNAVGLAAQACEQVAFQVGSWVTAWIRACFPPRSRCRGPDLLLPSDIKSLCGNTPGPTQTLPTGSCLLQERAGVSSPRPPSPEHPKEVGWQESEGLGEMGGKPEHTHAPG